MAKMAENYTLVTLENYHTVITDFIRSNEIKIVEYSDTTSCILRMVREGFFFNFDKNLLRSFLEDITYMYSPNDDKNKDRISNMLEESDDDESDDDSDGVEDPMANMMQMLMGGLNKKREDDKESEGNVVQAETVNVD